jgi:integrase
MARSASASPLSLSDLLGSGRTGSSQDADVDRLLRAIAHELQHARPKGKRQLNHRRHMASLRALFALVTVVHERGYRISEWLRWRWETVALQEARASILLSKPDRWVPFDLSPVAVAALGQMPALETGRVFPWLSRAQVYKAVDRFGIRWRPHESRRSVVTAVRQATGSIKAAQEYVSHASINTTLRYERPDVVTPSVRAGGKRARSGEPGK